MTQTPYIVFNHFDWTWIKLAGNPGAEINDALREAGFHWGRKRLARYAKEQVPLEKIIQLIGHEPLGVIDVRPPTKTCDYCQQLLEEIPA